MMTLVLRGVPGVGFFGRQQQPDGTSRAGRLKSRFNRGGGKIEGNRPAIPPRHMYVHSRGFVSFSAEVLPRGLDCSLRWCTVCRQALTSHVRCTAWDQNDQGRPLTASRRPRSAGVGVVTSVFIYFVGALFQLGPDALPTCPCLAGIFLLTSFLLLPPVVN